MKQDFQIPASGFQVPQRNLKVAGLRCHSIVNRKSQIVNGFTLVEILTTMVLLSLIVLALMAIFNSTQKAFRSGLTQTDILESGRLAMSLIASDLGAMTPSLSPVDTNSLWANVPDNYNTNNNINFYAVLANYRTAPPPLIQSLTASSAQRTNVLENFFSLSRQNIGGTPTWVGVGYAVFTNTPDTNGIYSLYRFYLTTNASSNPALVFNTFALGQYTNTAVWSYLMDGVVNLSIRPYDPNGFEMTNTWEYYYNGGNNTFTNQSTMFWQGLPGVYGFYMYSNTVPASVEVELGVMEDAVLQRAEGLNGAAQMNYLSNQAGQVHLFRQRVMIRNVDRTAYQ
ncbi:MAG TPA: prepilin-type N-terminal cleavage/methylation domain-containing protein [Candidatus Acidoferrales bacterium]|nr:prepilin-type N-terminal cleavage/methylation domain-containing protein [Candidatus Acidoferrales bacterium]